MKKEEKKYKYWIERLPCHVCQFPGIEHDLGVRLNNPAHIVSKGAGGKILGNLLPLCQKHHHESHLLGWGKFIEKYNCEIWMAGNEYLREYESLTNHKT